MFMHMFLYKATNLTLYMYLFIEISQCMLYLHAIYLCRCESKNCVPEAHVSKDGVCCKIVFLKFKDLKFINFHENKQEAFILFKLFHNWFAVSLFYY